MVQSVNLSLRLKDATRIELLVLSQFLLVSKEDSNTKITRNVHKHVVVTTVAISYNLDKGLRSNQPKYY